MAIDKLNFTGAGYGGDFKSSEENIGDQLIKLGNTFEVRKQNELERLRQESKDKYQRDRDTIQDTRYEADKKQKADENAAIANYANQVNMYQTGNALGQAQGQEISDMADKLTASGVTGSDFDKQLNDRVNQMYSQNRTRVSSNPTDALGFVKENVIVPQGVDPSKIIQINDNLENKFIRMQEKKDDLAWKEKEATAAEKRFNASLAEQRAERLAKEKERSEAKKEKEELNNAILAGKIEENKKQEKPLEKEVDVETGKIIIDPLRASKYEESKIKGIENISNEFNSNFEKKYANKEILSEKDLENEKLAKEQFLKENPNYTPPVLKSKAFGLAGDKLNKTWVGDVGSKVGDVFSELHGNDEYNELKSDYELTKYISEGKGNRTDQEIKDAQEKLNSGVLQDKLKKIELSASISERDPVYTAWAKAKKDEYKEFKKDVDNLNKNISTFESDVKKPYEVKETQKKKLELTTDEAAKVIRNEVENSEAFKNIPESVAKRIAVESAISERMNTNTSLKTKNREKLSDIAIKTEEKKDKVKEDEIKSLDNQLQDKLKAIEELKKLDLQGKTDSDDTSDQIDKYNKEIENIKSGISKLRESLYK